VNFIRDALIVRLTGLEPLLAFKRRLEVPLAHVREAAEDATIARRWYKGLRSPGTSVPPLIAAGTYYRQGERTFWAVHGARRVVVIRLAEEPYAQLVLQVADPAATVAAITAALRARRAS